MKLIKPSYRILSQSPGLEGIYEQIEIAGRICYKSKRPEGTTAKDFVDRMIKSGHTSMLEHGTVYLAIPHINDIEADSFFTTPFDNNPYSKVTKHNEIAYVSTNYRVIIENSLEEWLKYLCEPTEFHEKRITVRFTTSNSIMREFTRHRTMGFAVESTRYCNYSKDKFNNEITFIVPYWYTNPEEDIRSRMLEISLSDAEFSYLSLIKEGAKPQEAREVLPLATKCDMIMTGFVSDWRHLCKLRSSFAETGQPHPDMKALVDPLLEEFIACGYLEPLI